MLGWKQKLHILILDYGQKICLTLMRQDYFLMAYCQSSCTSWREMKKDWDLLYTGTDLLRNCFLCFKVLYICMRMGGLQKQLRNRTNPFPTMEKARDQIIYLLSWVLLSIMESSCTLGQNCSLIGMGWHVPSMLHNTNQAFWFIGQWGAWTL